MIRQAAMKLNGGIKLPGDRGVPPALGKFPGIVKGETISATMTAGEQVMELMRTVKCRLSASKVHGVGVIALRDIKSGEQLYCINRAQPALYTVTFIELKQKLQDTHPEILQLIVERWPRIVNGGSFISPNYDARLTSFMNHADTPNYDPVTDLAIAEIPKGEEVFEDYRQLPNYQKAFPWLPVV